MKLERAQEIYSEYEEGTLSPAMKSALEQQFSADPAVKQDYQDFSRVYTLLRNTSFEELDAPHGFRAKLLDRVAAESAGRQSKQAGGFAARLRDILMQPRRREATGALVAVLAAATVFGVFLKPVPSGRGSSVHGGAAPGGSPLRGNVGLAVPGASPAADAAPAVRVAVRTAADGMVYHDFTIQLPAGVKRATVDAYAITGTNQLFDPAARERQATRLLNAPLSLSGAERTTIPVALDRPAPAGSTLNVLVQWRSDDVDGPAGAEVVFTPQNPDDGATPLTAAPSNGSFFDSLQTIAAAYHTTVIADAAAAPVTGVQVWSNGASVDAALSSVAKSAGYAVKNLENNTYLVYKPAP